MGQYGTAFIAGAVIGGVAGTAATLWRAPQPGCSTRAQLGEQIIAHAGPAGGALSAAANGLNGAGARLVQGVNIATRFVEELIHPTTPGLAREGWVVPGRPAATTGTATATTTGTTETIGVALDPDAPVNPSGHAISPTSGQAQAYRAAAMNVTSLFGNRQHR